MGFEGEFASYEPLRRLLDSPKVQALQNRLRIRKPDTENANEYDLLLTKKEDLNQSTIQPDLVLAIDGSNLPHKAQNGFPGAEFGYITVASVLIDLKLVKELSKNEFINPKQFRETEKTSPFDVVVPGCNVILDSDKSAKASMRRALFEQMKNHIEFTQGESLLETYEELLKIKISSDTDKPKSPIDGVEEKMTYGYGEYTCSHSGEPLFSTDALRLHELMNPGGSNGEMFGQIMSTLEKLWLIHILRAFEKKGWLSTLKRVAFIIDGPLAVFSTSSWITKSIEVELKRINDLQKKINGQDLLIIGIEKSGTFFNHFVDIDTTADGVKDDFPKQSALLLGDDYIKKNIIFSESEKPYGADTYFGRKLFYKTSSGQIILPNIAYLRTFASGKEKKEYLKSISPADFPRLADVMNLLDCLVSSKHPNSVSPLISAHAEASIPLNLGKRIFEDIAQEMREKSKE